MCAGCTSLNRSTMGGSGSSMLTGIIYMDLKLPYTKDLKNTQSMVLHNKGKIIKIKEPFSGYGMYAEFNSNAIGDIAKKHGMKKVHYADMEYFSILGIWREEVVHVYGE